MTLAKNFKRSKSLSSQNVIQVVKLPNISQMTDQELQTYAKELWQRLAKPKQGSDDGNSKE